MTRTNSVSNTEVQDWFMLHVKSSLLKKSFSSLYFTVGLVEEAAELSEELKKSWVLPASCSLPSEAMSEIRDG